MTFLVFAYNEAKRIRHVLDHAQNWATEIVVLDKGSTDGTREICQSYGAPVRLISIPYSERGHENYTTLIAEHTTEDWIFLSTCSEVPTRKLIKACQEIIAAKANQLDLIYVPRLMYYFGLHRSPENGGVAYYPFLFHKDRVQITGEIHNNFHARDVSRTFRIPYTEDCCVHHMTHPTVQSFWLASLDYFEVETQNEGPPEKLIRESFKNIEKLSKRMLLEGDNWLPFYCALASYEMGKALSIWEKAEGKDRAALKYEKLANQLIAEEWTKTPSDSSIGSPSVIPANRYRALKPLIVGMAQLPYLLVKLSYAFRRPKIKND
jgi:glycosyltransferase involved in cell wall biosynthesis